ncbi:MerR family transcriptional regulator [Albidovulum sediminicola]|uniref:MerR family transcriptional regulator n=1 Tax=Albidovulum sediminicola TaxID=2984331 RepID=A0ABT2Z136_9RHOB|nr:MerR family transcriptional regulator [Defluviimonas sp. WL0075]MCV2864727.1 MerR family transcriptional regulator [Defluviimonas sp. WL0075]
MPKSAEAFRTISEVGEALDTPAHVLRFWESQFAQIKPMKRAGGRRYYRPQDIALLAGIKKLLHDDGITIRGVKKILRENGVKYVAALAPAAEGSSGAEASQTPPSAAVTSAPVSAPVPPITAPAPPVSAPAAPSPVARPTAAPRPAPRPSADDNQPFLPFGLGDASPAPEAPMEVDVPPQPDTRDGTVHAFPSGEAAQAVPLAVRIRAMDPAAVARNRPILRRVHDRLQALAERRRTAGTPPEG